MEMVEAVIDNNYDPNLQTSSTPVQLNDKSNLEDDLKLRAASSLQVSPEQKELQTKGEKTLELIMMTVSCLNFQISSLPLKLRLILHQ